MATAACCCGRRAGGLPAIRRLAGTAGPGRHAARTGRDLRAASRGRMVSGRSMLRYSAGSARVPDPLFGPPRTFVVAGHRSSPDQYHAEQSVEDAAVEQRLGGGRDHLTLHEENGPQGRPVVGESHGLELCAQELDAPAGGGVDEKMSVRARFQMVMNGSRAELAVSGCETHPPGRSASCRSARASRPPRRARWSAGKGRRDVWPSCREPVLLPGDRRHRRAPFPR